MPNPFEAGDEAKNKYLDKALHANDEAVSGSKFTDLMNKESSIYQGMPKPEKVVEEVEAAPTVDSEGYPIVSPIHTYKADLTGIISDDKLSMSRIAMMNTGQDRVENKKNPKDIQNRIYMIVGIVLLVISIGIIGGIWVLTAQEKEVTTQNVAVKEKYLIFAERKENYNITKSTKTEITNRIKELAQLFKEEDSILEIIPAVTSEMDDKEYRSALQTFLEKVSMRIPDTLYRTFADRFFLGLYSKKGVTNPFFIVYTSSYDTAYPALLEWEGLMQDDFNWFTNTANRKVGDVVDRLTFKDRIILNKDIRSLEDSDGRVAFFYTFLDDHTILFARTSDTLKKVMDRVREAKFQ